MPPALFSVTTPLGPGVLRLSGFTGSEGISRLFELHLELVADADAAVAFDQLLGQPVTVAMTLPDGAQRHLSGIAASVTRGATDGMTAPLRRTHYRMAVVPKLWLLTHRQQSRTFQQLAVPDILKAVLQGLDVSFRLHGTYEKRDYCAQYRESDFAFASRLMEEEGIFYFFKHGDGTHQMIVADSPVTHLPVPGATTVKLDAAEGGVREEDRVQTWEKRQELRAGKVTLWDYCFEMPDKHLEATTPVGPASLAAGTVTHKLALPANEKLELYDYPGGYAQRFDGVAPGGGERPADIQKILQDNRRTAGIRAGEEAAHALIVEGTSDCRQLTAGHKFTLDGHDDANGEYVLTSVEHAARLGSVEGAGGGPAFTYGNRFSCIPAALPYRPPRATPRPFVHGCQTAIVVGPAGEEIFTDKYGRVKVQFPWDREGKKDANSSCWVRVASFWAGRQWGAVHIPRVGQEVVVDFEEGDPDRPIIVGSVYNADNMPPYALPANKTQSGIKSRSTPQAGASNFNEIRFEDKKGSEQLFIHAEKNQDIEVENDETHWVGRDRTKTIDRDEITHVKRDRTETVDKNETITVHGNRTETVDKDESITVTGARTESVGKDESITLGKNRTTTISKDDTLSIGENRAADVGKNDTLDVGKKLVVNAGDEIVFKTGQASITMKKDGTIEIKGKDIKVQAMAGVEIKGATIKANGQGQVEVKSAMVKVQGDGMLQLKAPMSQLNGDGMLMAKGGLTMIN